MPRTAVTRQYNSFCGVDIVATFGNSLIGELQGISFTVSREKAPIYTMGDPNPRSFSRGKRGIAGSLIFTLFDREALLEALSSQPNMRYLANVASLRGRYGAEADNIMKEGGGVVSEITTDPSSGTVGILSTADDGIRNYISTERAMAKAMYYDQLPPFTIVLTAANEYGMSMKMQINGVEIMNAGSGTSIDDITIDTTCTFVATDIIPWFNQGYVDSDGQFHDIGDRKSYPISPGSPF